MRFATELARRGLDRRLRAGQPHRQPSTREAGRRQRQSPAAPFVDAPDRLVGRNVEHPRRLGRRHGQALERDFGDHAQRALRARHQPRDVEPRDVLHHAATEGEMHAIAVDHADAQHEVAHRTRIGPAWPRKPRGDRAAQRRPRSEVRRLECKHLPFARQRRLELGQRRAGERGDDQLRGRVVDNAAQRPRVERLAGNRIAVERLAAAATDRQWRCARRAVADARAPRLDDGVAHRPAAASLSR